MDIIEAGGDLQWERETPKLPLPILMGNFGISLRSRSKLLPVSDAGFDGISVMKVLSI